MLETIARFRLFEPGQRVVVGVSGGPDSTALLHALHSVRAGLEIELTAAHLNHGFRGAEADEDAASVRGLCDRLDIPLHTEFIDVPALRRERRISAQEAAREARHAFLRRTALDAGAERIALAHTSDDRVETILLNLFRGSGIEGLRGFPASDLPIVRPLYELTREDVEAYCSLQGLEPRLDSSNNDLKYRRNRIRSELLPNLRTYYNPRVERAILRLAEIAAADDEVLQALVSDRTPKLATFGTGRVEIDLDGFRAQPLSIQRRTLRIAMAHVLGSLTDVGMESVDRVLAQLLPQSRSGRQWRDSATALELEFSGGRMSIRLHTPVCHVQPWQLELGDGCAAELPDGGRAACRVCTSAAEASAWISGISAAGSVSTIAAFRAAEVRLPISVRSWRPGDRMRPIGVGGSRKLQDLFVDRKVPRTVRAIVPVVVDAGNKILVVGELALDESAVLRAAGQTAAEPLIWIVLLEAEPQAGPTE
jgi:tRNA(Ile)-lysidine synthase